MSDRLHLGTKKGLFELRRDGGGWAVANTRFLGEPVSMLLHDPRDGALYAALALGHFGVKLRRSRDGGASWQEIPAPAFPKTDPDGPSVSYLFCLETGGADHPGWLWCGTIPGALFLSPDHVPYLQSRFRTVRLEERLGRVPYLFGMKAPYYIFIGRKA